MNSYRWWSGLLFCVAAGSANAQSVSRASNSDADSGVLEEITVTAQKRSENLQSVPIAVSVVTGEQLQNSGVFDSMQLSTVTPGFSVASQAEYFQPHLRGIGTTSNGPGVENPVALYVDGVYYPSQTTAPRDLFDMTQVSILKGPQGTLFGRNATAGVIQMSTRDPTHDAQAIFQTSLDNYLTTRSNLYVSRGLTDDLAANLSLRYGYQAHGWGDNLANGDEVFRTSKDIAVRSKWFYTPSNATTLKLSADYSELADTSGLCIRPYPGTQNLIPGFRESGNRWDIDSDITCRNDTRQGGASLTLDQEVGFAQLVSISGFRRYNVEPIFSVTASPNPGEYLNIRANGDMLSQEIQLVSPTNDTFTWTGGLYYFYSGESHGPPGLQVFLRGPLAPTPFSLAQLNIQTHLVTNSAAAFAQGTLRVADDTHLTLGIRYTYERKTLTGSEEGFLANGTDIGLLPLPDYPHEETFYRPTWRVALDHQFSPDHMGYLSYNRGYKSGGYNGNDPTNLPYGPETLDAYELGLKNEWLGHRLSMNAAAFYYDYTNIQVSRYERTEQIYNGARAKVAGLDIDGRARLTEAFSLSGGLEWLHSKFTDFPNAQFATALPGGGAVYYTGDASGNRLPYAPNFTADLAADYVVAMASGSFDLNVTDSYNSGFFTEADNALRQSGYDLLNSSLTWTSGNGSWSVRLWGSNLLNKAVLSLAVTQPVSYNAVYGNPPRTYGVTFRYQLH